MKTRDRSVTVPRQILRYLVCEKVPQLKLKQVAAMTGDCDHSTVIYCRDHIASMLRLNAFGRPYNKDVAEIVERIESALNQNYYGTYAPRCYPMAGVI